MKNSDVADLKGIVERNYETIRDALVGETIRLRGGPLHGRVGTVEAVIVQNGEIMVLPWIENSKRPGERLWTDDARRYQLVEHVDFMEFFSE